MSITATELKNNLGKYLELANEEDIFITKNGKVIAKLSNPNKDKETIMNELAGVLASDMKFEDVIEERRKKI